MGVPSVLAARGASEKVRVGFIGVGNRGSQLLTSFMKQQDVQVAALCDVYQPYIYRNREQVDKRLLESLGSRVPQMGEDFGDEVSRYKDFRRVLEQKDIDAVVIATPDHWHAIQMIAACEAGKDVYVEKPLTVTIREGRRMVEAQKRTNRVVQVGLHRRSSNLYREVHAMVKEGAIGKVTVARAYRISNMYPNGIGRYSAVEPPQGLDWDLWLGPRPEREHKLNMTPYKFRWWQTYSSQVANWGVHYFDTIRWVLDQEAPVSISAHGGRFALDDDRTVPDTIEAIFELPCGALLVFGQYEASGGSAIAYGELEFRGTLGNMYTGSEGGGLRIIPSPPGQFQEDTKSPLEPMKKVVQEDDLTDQHVRNFLDCVKSRERCNCDIEAGHRSTTFAHLANIALATKSRIEWDPKEERIISPPEANEHLHYEYRNPWKLG
ncbi:hypothetical protein AMJ85_07755 [candidate division BRC1 bacterium SM23_51]|nr:MAG: hypothetical protein AMJ85_07755 [candidate division BRC1 bacterium SM23_51]